MSKITKIVLSGGPSGGKSKALRMLKSELEELGFTVYPITECATAVLESGFDRSRPVYEFQKAIATLQLERECEYENMVTDSSNVVIICDRGLMDCRVYLGDEDFALIKKELGLSDIDLRDRYDAVFHLDSTSTDSNVKYKNSENRIEARDVARDINEVSLRAWCGNPHYRFIPVKPTFDEKFALLLREVKAFLGIPKPLEIERKFLIKYPDIKHMMTLPCSKSEIEQTYLYNENGRYRLRKRGENGDFIYIKTEKRKISETVREEIETRLSRGEYDNQMMSGAVIGSIKKDRYCVMYNGTYYEIDIFPFWKKQAYLEVELLDENDEIKLPDFVELIREVTYEPEYKNISLCMKIPDED
ncbi:MAG: AAA family ATPase [Ruminococcus sp.]|nr:AAA family ATPase [Ruminococcus sp.]